MKILDEPEILVDELVYTPLQQSAVYVYQKYSPR